jgi:hypothetical protein
MKKLLSGVAAVSVCVLAAPVSAQMSGEQQVGSRFEREAEQTDDRYARAFRTAFRHCYYKNFPDRAEAFLAQTDAYSEDIPKGTVDRLSLRANKWSAGCQYDTRATVLKSQMSFNTRALRYMMAEGSYIFHYPDAPPAGMMPDTTASAPDWNVDRNYVSTGEDLGKAHFFGDFADCIVAKDPVGADRLLRTELQSTKERAAAMAMVDALGACLVAGNELELTPENIRSFAADGLWQRYVATPARSAAS